MELWHHIDLVDDGRHVPSDLDREWLSPGSLGSRIPTEPNQPGALQAFVLPQMREPTGTDRAATSSYFSY